MSMNVDNSKSLLIDRIKESPYINLIPDYLRENEDFLVFFYLMAKEWDTSTTYIDNFTDLINPDKVPKQFIENLGAYSNFTYNKKASVEFNREVLMRMFTVWKMRGTEHSIVMNAIHGDNPAYIGGDIFIPNYPISTDKASLSKPRDRIFILSKSKLSSRDVFEDAREFRAGVLELEVPYMSKQIKEKVYAVTQAGVKYIFITTTQFSPNIDLPKRDIDEYGNLAFNMVVYPKTRYEKENYYDNHGMDTWLEINMHISDPWRYDTLILSRLSTGLPLLSGPSIDIEDSIIQDMGASMLPLSYLCQPFDTKIKDNSKYIISNTGEYIDYKTKKGIQFINRDISSLENNQILLENDIDYLKDLILSNSTLGNLSYQGKLSGYRNHEYSSFSCASDIETIDTLYNIDTVKDKNSIGYDSAENPLDTFKDTFEDTVGDIEIADTDTSYLKDTVTYDSSDIQVLLRNINATNPNILDVNMNTLDSPQNTVYGYYNSAFTEVTDTNNITDTNLKTCITKYKSLSSLLNNQYYSTEYDNIDILSIFTYNNNTYVCLQGDNVTNIDSLGIWDNDSNNNKTYTDYYIDNIYTMDMSDNNTLRLKQSDNISNKTRVFIFKGYALDKDLENIENLHIEINPNEYKGNLTTVYTPYTEHIKLSFNAKCVGHFFGYMTPAYVENSLKTISFGDFSFKDTDIQNTLKNNLICQKDYDSSHLSIQALYSFVNPYTDNTTNPSEYIYLSIKALDDIGINSLKSITKVGIKSLDIIPNVEITNIGEIDTNHYVELPYIDDNGNFSKYRPTSNEKLFLFKKTDFLYSDSRFKNLISNKLGYRVFLDTEGYISIKTVNTDNNKNHINFVVNLYYDGIKAKTDINIRKDITLNTDTNKLNNASITIPNGYTKLYVSSYGKDTIKKYSVIPLLSNCTYYLDKHTETYSGVNYTVVSIYDCYSNYIAKTNPKNILIVNGQSNAYKNTLTIEMSTTVENANVYYSYDRTPANYTEFDINTKY